VIERLKAGNITPTVIQVQEKVTKSADRMILAGQLSTELLTATKRSEKDRKERNDPPNRVVQKYMATRRVGRLKRMKLMKEG
jgi:hypothetical protein